MTRVCIVGAPEVDLREELLSRETAREALATYALSAPWANTVAVDTVSLGAAVSLLNDLDWYLVRFAATAFVREPSVSETEWLSRSLATAVRDGRVDPDAVGEYLKLYGVVEENDAPGDESDAPGPEARLAEPLYVRRTDGDVPEYDLREVEETVAVCVTEDEFGD